MKFKFITDALAQILVENPFFREWLFFVEEKERPTEVPFSLYKKRHSQKRFAMEAGNSFKKN